MLTEKYLKEWAKNQGITVKEAQKNLDAFYRDMIDEDYREIELMDMSKKDLITVIIGLERKNADPED